MNRPWVHLTPSTLLAIHEKVTATPGEPPSANNMAWLEASVATPQATKFGVPLLKDGVEIAAAYLFFLCRNHPFRKENNRTALAACLVFLQRNRLLYPVKLDVEAWEKLVLDVAASRLDREGTTVRLRELTPHP